MISYYAKVAHDINDLGPIADACAYYDAEYLVAVQEADISTWRGRRIDELAKQISGLIGFRYCQLQDLEAILGYLEIREMAIKGNRRKHYLEHYNRALIPTTVEKFVEADEAVLSIATLRNRVAFTRNKFLALSKQHDYLHYQVGNLTKLLVAGVNDALL